MSRHGLPPRIGWAFYSTVGAVWALLLLLALLDYLTGRRRPGVGLLLLLLFVFLGGLIPVFDVFGARRHVVYLTPLVFLLGIGWFCSWPKPEKRMRLTMATFTVWLVAQVPIAHKVGDLEFDAPTLREPTIDEWAVWVAKNLKGEIAILDGADLIGMAADELGTAGHITLVPAPYDDLQEAIEEFRRLGIDYLLLDARNGRMRPYSAVYASEWSEHFTLIKTLASDRRRVERIDVFRVEATDDR
jgi:hypothetical protein